MRKLLLVLFIGLSLGGCAELEKITGGGATPGPTPIGVPPTGDQNDPVVVNAEKVLLSARDTFNVLIQLEYQHREYLKSKVPEVHDYTNYLRKNAIGWIEIANGLKDTYANSKTSANKAKLDGKLSDLKTKKNETNDLIVKTGLK